MTTLTDSPLGQATDYVDHYDPSLLFAIARQEARQALGVGETLPFYGVDIWNAYELSWLNHQGLPQVALLEMRVPCHSASLVESKSLKLYLNSFANSRFTDADEVESRITKDIAALLATAVEVQVKPVVNAAETSHSAWQKAVCIDDQTLAVDCYEVTPALLETMTGNAEETLCSHLLRSRCPVTGQPDWASVFIRYRGRAVSHQGLLRYLVSFRNHQGFHEQLIEQIYLDIQRRCQPEQLTVYGRFTRRGGVDINPWRSSQPGIPDNCRTLRQ